MDLMQANNQLQKCMIRVPIPNILERQTKEHMLMNVDYNDAGLSTRRILTNIKEDGD